MIGIADWTSRGKNLCQDLLALFERDAPQIVAVNVDEIEDVVQHRNVAAGIYATSMLTDAGRHWALGRSFQFFNHRGHRGHRGILLVGGRSFRYSLTFFVFFYAVFWSLR